MVMFLLQAMQCTLLSLMFFTSWMQIPARFSRDGGICLHRLLLTLLFPVITCWWFRAVIPATYLPTGQRMMRLYGAFLLMTSTVTTGVRRFPSAATAMWFTRLSVVCGHNNILLYTQKGIF